MTEKLPKAKFRIGQMVWYIANGYVSNTTIRAVFQDKWDSIAYGLRQADYTSPNHVIHEDNVKYEHELYPSKEALIKSIKEQEDDE